MPRTASTFKGLNDWIEVFRAGTHTDSKGSTVTFSEGDLDQMVANVSLGAPPAVLGHPKDHDPAYAWAREVRRDGDTLLAKFSDINPAFAAGVDSGAYRNRSIAVYRDKDHGWRLQHVGWLGAAPPAITGLAPLEYAAPADAEAHEFAAGDNDDCMTTAFAIDNIASLLRGLRDYVISKDGLDTANTVLSDWQITAVATAAATLRDAAAAAINSPAYAHPTGNTMNFTQADLDRAAAVARTEAEARFTAQSQQLQQLQGERQTERISTQIGAWKAAGLVLPAEEPGLSEFMASLEAGSSVEFSFTRATGEQPVKQTPGAWFSAFVASRKPLVKLGARNDGALPEAGDNSDYRDVVDRAHTYIKEQADKGITVSNAAAVAHVQKVNAR